MRKVQVAIVAPSVRAPGGQAVQAAELLRGWRGDAAVDAWLVSTDRQPWPICDAIARLKYIRRILALNVDMARLARHLARADVVHVFGAAYRPFLLAPLPAVIVARSYRRPILLNYHNGEGPDHLARSPLARLAIRQADRIVVPSTYLID